ncbi:MAG: class I SAM-dependent methyltransferase [Alphaproteobacteria bacterium]|nr:class I SAM-dependent methyltransferase [Alphaproteobacteria bacterium]
MVRNNDKTEELAAEDVLPDDPQQRIEWTYAAEDVDRLAKRYDKWAEIYDADLSDVHGYVAPQKAVALLAQHVPKDAMVLDAGAGTGMVGVLLAKEGYRHLKALDYSDGMLARAREKGVYQTLAQADLNEPIDMADDSVDAVICIGTLTYLKPRVLYEFVRVTRPGGVIAYTSKTTVHVTNGFQAVENELSDFMKWRLLERSDEFVPMPETYPDIVYRLYAWQVK